MSRARARRRTRTRARRRPAALSVPSVTVSPGISALDRAAGISPRRASREDGAVSADALSAERRPCAGDCRLAPRSQQAAMLVDAVRRPGGPAITVDSVVGEPAGERVRGHVLERPVDDRAHDRQAAPARGRHVDAVPDDCARDERAVAGLARAQSEHLPCRAHRMQKGPDARPVILLDLERAAHVEAQLRMPAAHHLYEPGDLGAVRPIVRHEHVPLPPRATGEVNAHAGVLAAGPGHHPDPLEFGEHAYRTVTSMPVRAGARMRFRTDASQTRSHGTTISPQSSRSQYGGRQAPVSIRPRAPRRSATGTGSGLVGAPSATSAQAGSGSPGSARTSHALTAPYPWARFLPTACTRSSSSATASW